MRLISSLIVLISLAGLSGCSVQHNNPDFEYPPSASLDSNEWPELVDTQQLAALAEQPSDSDLRAIASVEARADALRQRSQSSKATTTNTSARADALRRRALTTRPTGISSDRIQRLRERAEALRNAPI